MSCMKSSIFDRNDVGDVSVIGAVLLFIKKKHGHCSPKAENLSNS